MGSYERKLRRDAARRKVKEHPKSELKLTVPQRVVVAQVCGQYASPDGKAPNAKAIRKLHFVERDLKTKGALDQFTEAEEDAADNLQEWRIGMARWTQRMQEALSKGEPFDEDKPEKPKDDLEDGWEVENFTIRTSVLVWIRDAFESPKANITGGAALVSDLLDEIGIRWEDPEDEDDEDPEVDALAEADAETEPESTPAGSSDTVKLVQPDA